MCVIRLSMGSDFRVWRDGEVEKKSIEAANDLRGTDETNLLLSVNPIIHFIQFSFNPYSKWEIASLQDSSH